MLILIMPREGRSFHMLAGFVYGKEYQDLWSRQLEDSAREILESFYEKICRQEGRQDVRYWGDKHPHHDACLPFLEKHFPESLYIYIVRDPRDTICSIMEMNKWGIEEAFSVWQRIANGYEQFHDATSKDRIYRAYYEEIVGDYAGEIGKMISWLKLDCDDSFLNLVRNKQGTDFHRPNRLVPTDFKAKSVASWRQKLNPEESSFILKQATDYLAKHGYPET